MLPLAAHSNFREPVKHLLALPALLLTGYADAEILSPDHGRDRGPGDFRVLSKPASCARVLDEIELLTEPGRVVA